ncbi:hypothetical protein PHYSODRAFT_484829 [Phytophthora sojae]|uniref:Uncharacterized protein n=1 Tax=Phytophthora sojae (strain P6497) TaxID=1094619 RepID=G4YY85_PHYSP|nr:hypothetical protein PHYSODRAFT_484829 [Phytophthora sojae]EGZ23236.1 hypothetical protein PHYSODRAFT_484829 [Phytophthora sojae]|eukprot:XP_009518524.1 hypothetical protein PHYSODRAFT_484829 [Phytophthora sojae]
MRAATARSGAEREYVAVSFFSDVFERTDRDESPAPIFGNTSPTKSAQPSPAHERALVRVVVHLFLRAVSSCSVERLLRPAVSNNMTSNEELQEQFTSLVPALYDVLDEMFRESMGNTSDPTPGGQDACLSALVDTILSLVYNRGRFGIIRLEVSALLDHHQSPESLKRTLEGWFQAYTAQARVFITSSAPEPPNGTLNQHSPFCGRWVLDPQSIQVDSLSSNQVQRVIQSFRFTDVAQLAREFGCIDVELDTDTATPRLCLLSALSFANDNTEARTSMLLDGRLRVFRALPSGLSSMIPTAGGWLIGDYVGTLSDDALSLNIDLFAFAEGD